MDIQIDEEVTPATPEQIAEIEAEREAQAEALLIAQAEYEALVAKLVGFGLTEEEAQRIVSA